MTATDPAREKMDEPKTAPCLAEAIRLIRQKALDQLLDLIDARILQAVQNNPYMTKIAIHRDQLTTTGRPAPFIPLNLEQWSRDAIFKHFKMAGIDVLMDGVGLNWILKLTLPTF